MSKRKKYSGIIGIIFISISLLASAAFAGIPEPGMILYGQVYDTTGALVTSGELTWTFAPTGGGSAVTVSTDLREIEGPDGLFSYFVLIPFETEVPGHPVSENTIPLTQTLVTYTRTAQVVGTTISRTNTVTISIEDRGTANRVTLGITDEDNDGLPDEWEQAIVDADPNDSITSIEDVNPGDDFDGDGITNRQEYNDGTNPTVADGPTEIPAAQRNALIDIYISTSGDDWTKRTNWNGSAGTECRWYGVTCNLAGNNIVAIDLSNNGLYGMVPASIGTFTGLQTLGLSGNSLTGEIPSTIKNLTNLNGNQSDLRWNALYTSDTTVRNFLNSKQSGGDWEGTQTVAPANLRISAVTGTTVTLMWDAINYTGDSGGYEVFYSTSRKGPYSYFDTTADKTMTNITVTGLDTNTNDYHFLVRTVTDSHANNPGAVYSEYNFDETAITALGTRTLPANAGVDADINVGVAIDIDNGNAPDQLFINESMPSGWTLNSASPEKDSYNAATGEIGWILIGSEVMDRTIIYNVHIPDTETAGAVRSFSGEVNYNDAGSNPVVVQTGGDQEIEIGSLCHSHDTNQDWTIGDFELLDAIDAWAAGNLGDFELLDLIDLWAYGSYCWDNAAGAYKAEEHDSSGMCL